MVTAYYGKNWGKIWRRELLPQFFTNSHEIWHRCLPLGVDVQDTFFDSGRKCVAMVTAYYGKNGGKILRRELLPQFFTNSHEIWHRCLPWGVDVQDTFFDSGRKCVAMVTAYYTVKKYCGAGVLITFSDISSLQYFVLFFDENTSKILQDLGKYCFSLSLLLHRCIAQWVKILFSSPKNTANLFARLASLGGSSSSVLSVFFNDKFALSQSDARISVAYNSCRWLTRFMKRCPDIGF